MHGVRAWTLAWPAEPVHTSSDDGLPRNASPNSVLGKELSMIIAYQK